LERVRNSLINILMDFDKDMTLFKSYLDRLINNFYRSSSWNHGIETDNIFWVKADTTMGHQMFYGPWEMGAMDAITVD
jgi:hypothetical protein